MAKNNKHRNKKEELKVNQSAKEEVNNQPTVEEGNYIIEVISEDKIIKKLVVVKGAINITKIHDGGLTVDLI